MPELKDPNQELETFREEMRLIQDEEVKNEKTAHFANKEFDPAELTSDDLAIWNEIKNGTVTTESFGAYSAKLEYGGASHSRMTFGAFVRNKANSIIGNRYLDAMEARGKK